MAASDVEIVNSALIKIREKTISSLSEDRKAARIASRQYPRWRRGLLRSYPWNFAITRSAPLATRTPGPQFGFSFRLALPHDNIRVLGIFDENEPQQNYTSSRIAFKVEGGDMFTDEEAAQIVYIRDETDTSKFDPLFEEALATKLAVDFGYNFTAAQSLINDLRQEFKEVIREARNTNAIVGTPEVIQASDWVDSRVRGGPPRIGPIDWG